ncbi:MAG: PBECR4 domain-containing protein [Candidatus Gastranaerophilales bacterium]|nr:PBECR4 domain-containing protein [Candidatus Gastranaerophilales bacterium]
MSKSQYFDEFYINERIEYLEYLESMLDSCELTFLINPKEYAKYTKIKADFLLENNISLRETIILYLFLVKESSPQICNECKVCSFFRKHEIDFRRGTSKATMLLVEKYENVDTVNQECTVLFRNPAYIEGQGIIQE